jgi:8-oxo-dGTP pyrophosphatase MutT (NUDIX family)
MLKAVSIAEARPAATVVVLRDFVDAPLEVLLVRRNDKVAFMAGAYVFPGGRVDEHDVAGANRLTPAITESRFSDLTLEQEWPYRVAAVREVQEEANVTIDVADLVPFAHWVTPEIETRRYDTRFFLGRMPEGQTARHDEGEMTELEWLTPHDAVARCASGAILLPPPTWTTLKQLARFASIDDALQWAASKPIVRVMPGFIKDEGQTMLTLPGDPLHPTIPGWEIPEDTRFVLQEGKRWTPVRS